MSLVKKLLSGLTRTARKRSAGEAHAVMVHLELVGGSYGSEDEVESVRLLGDDCEEAVRSAAAGEFEGEEFGDATCVLYFSGPDADVLWTTIAPLVRASSLARGGHVMQRFGGEGAREARITL